MVPLGFTHSGRRAERTAPARRWLSMGDTGPPQRVRSLDGLRGLAALIVVLGHATVASLPALAAVALMHPVRLSSFERAITYTPLHILWSGNNWVIVFFVLSGFVLSLAASGGNRFVGTTYYPNRFVRLYIPVWAALIVAVIAHVAISHSHIDGATLWLNLHDAPLSIGPAAHDVTLIHGGGGGSFTTVLWSLQWEVIFSLLLPLYLLIASRLNLILVAGVSLLIVLLAGAHNEYARYLPTFMLGTVIAYGRAGIVRHLTRRRVWVTLGISSCFLAGNWWMPSGVRQDVGEMLVALGAAGLVICGMAGGQFAGLLRTRPFQIVGRRSYSLYLVHEPLVVAMAFALGGRPSLPLLLVTALPVVAIVTELFYRLVERPSHRWARLAGQRVHAHSLRWRPSIDCASGRSLKP
jgi:peptidoglycan/LPS O-acetylase OafA/YrhL